jgi:hypothetical protein
MRRFIKKPAKKNTHVLKDDEKESILEASYLGKKGYTIPKSVLSESEYAHLKEELNISPEVHGIQYGVPQEAGSFPVYRENDKKIYVPRFYGIERYGLPDKSEITSGESINVHFAKPLRDYQENIVSIYHDHVSKPIAQGSENTGGGAILEVPCGRGKCLGKNTLVMMSNGDFKKVQDIKEGDYLMGDNSTPRKVLSLARGRETMYKVHHDCGYYIVNKSHILSLRCENANDRYPVNSIVDISVEDYLKLPQSYRDPDMPHLCGYRVPIHFKKQPLEDDPYFVGHLNNGVLPENVIKNGISERLEVLAGIIDAHGNNYDYYYDIWSDNEERVSFVNTITMKITNYGNSNYLAQFWKKYPYVILTKSVQFPRIVITYRIIYVWRKLAKMIIMDLKSTEIADSYWVILALRTIR